jgi:drug/metabolite transporter (DMT)-like permease
MSAAHLTALAPLAFILVWSCGYIVAKFVTPYSPPLTFLSLRYVGIMVLMGCLAYSAGTALPRGRALWHTAAAGVLMQAGYLSGCWMGIAQGMPSGVMALIVNMQPVMTAVFAVWMGQRIALRQWLGLGLGFAGVALVLSTKLGAVASSAPTIGWAAVILGFGALFAMTAGTLYQKHFCPGIDPRASQTVQALASLSVTLPFALLLETQPVQWSLPFWGALAFSVLVLSGVGTSLLLWLIERGAATTVTAYLYWVPPVSSLLAWLLFDERIALLAWPGFLMVALGVYWVVSAGASSVSGAAPSTNSNRPLAALAAEAAIEPAIEPATAPSVRLSHKITP